MLRVGLTGGIGSGKSTVSAQLEKLGAHIVDADVVAREVVELGSSNLERITDHFGQSILLNSGSLDRGKLREIIFQNADEKTWLENLLHPAIRSEIKQQLNNHSESYSVLSSPLLIETNQQALVDLVVIVDLPEALQIERASARDSTEPEQIRAIMASQASREERLASADKIVDNSGSIESTLEQTNALHNELIKQLTYHTAKK